MNQPNRYNEQFPDPDSSGDQQSPFPQSASQSQLTPQQQMSNLQHQLYYLQHQQYRSFPIQNHQRLPLTLQPSIQMNNSSVNYPSQTLQGQASNFSVPSLSAPYSQQQMSNLQHQLYLQHQQYRSFPIQNHQRLPLTLQPSIQMNNSSVNYPSQTLQGQASNFSVPSLSVPHPHQQMTNLQHQLYLQHQQYRSFPIQNHQRLPLTPQPFIQTNNSRINDLSRIMNNLSQKLKAQKLQLQKLQEQATNNRTSSLASNGQPSIQTNNSRMNDLLRTMNNLSQKLKAQELQLQKLQEQATNNRTSSLASNDQSSIQTNNSIVNNPPQMLQEQATNNYTGSLDSNGQPSTGFSSLNDDVLYLILQFFSTKSYIIFGILNKRCRQIFLTKYLPKQTCLYAFAPLKTIIKEHKHGETFVRFGYSDRLPFGIAKSIVYFSRHDVLNWILKNQSSHDIQTKPILISICETAAREKRLYILSVIFNNSNERTLKYLKGKNQYRIATSASKNGHLEVLIFLKEKRCFIDGSKCVNGAAGFGHLHVIQWLTANGYPLTQNILTRAAFSGNLQLLQWLRYYNGCTWSEDTFASAASKGNVAILEWLKGNGCPWSKNTFKFAASSGNIATLEWLKGNGCPWSKDTFPWALTSENKNVINVSSWLLRNGCHWGTDIFEYLSHRYGKIELNTLKWLKVQGYRFTENSFKYAACYASVHDELNILDWLLEIGCPWNNNTIYYRDEINFELEVEDWLRRNGFAFSIVDDEEFDDDFFNENPDAAIEAAVDRQAAMERAAEDEIAFSI